MAKEKQDAEIKDTEQQPEMNELLKLLLEEKAAEAKERKEKKDKEREALLQSIQSQIDSAKEQNERTRLRRELCDGSGGPAHQTLNPSNGNKRSAWRGQVNSDGTFSPVCCKCLLVMPPIKASDEQKKEGVRLDAYVELSVKALENWHKKSFDNGCDNQNCYLCHPVAEAVAV